MKLARISPELWVGLHYRYRGELYRFNLPLQKGEKILDGLRLDFSWETISEGLRLSLKLEPFSSVELESLEITGALEYGDDVKSIFVNGYQSWTSSRERYPGERISALNWPGRLISFQRFGDARFYNYSERKGRFHGYSYAYLRYPEHILFAGSLDENAGYTALGIDIRRNLFSITKDVKGLALSGPRLMLDLVLMEGEFTTVLDSFVRYRSGSSISGRRALWWSAGKGRGSGGDEVRIRKVLASLRERKIPLDYFMVSDGWHSGLGNWDIPAPGIPSGMASLATEIRGSGYKPALWFAPFVVGVDSVIYRSRKDWLARDARNKIRPVGWMPEHGGLFFALDLSRSDVREYITECVVRFRDKWKFDFLRLDLLYAAAFYPPRGKSRGEAMREAVDFLVSIKGSLQYEMAGVPLESVFGKTEYCRVGADTTPYWEHGYKRNIHARERASTVNALRSTVGRRHLNGRFFANSLDAFFLGGRVGRMESSRRYTQVILHYLLGTLFGGCGDIENYSNSELRTLLSLFPVVEPYLEEVSQSRRTVTVRYKMSGRSYLTVSNLAERVRSFLLPEGLWFEAAALDLSAGHLLGGDKYQLRPGVSRTFMKVEEQEEGGFAGSDGHIIPGCEIASMNCHAGEWTIRPAAGVLQNFRVWIQVHGEGPLRINGEDADSSKNFGEVRFVSGTVRVEPV